MQLVLNVIIIISFFFTEGLLFPYFLLDVHIVVAMALLFRVGWSGRR